MESSQAGYDRGRSGLGRTTRGRPIERVGDLFQTVRLGDLPQVVRLGDFFVAVRPEDFV